MSSEMKRAFLVYTQQPDAALVGRVMQAFCDAVKTDPDCNDTYVHHRCYAEVPGQNYETFPPGVVTASAWTPDSEPDKVVACVNDNWGRHTTRGSAVVFSTKGDDLLVEATEPVLKEFVKRLQSGVQGVALNIA